MVQKAVFFITLHRQNNKVMDFRMQDRMELKALVDFYATESDKNNQDFFMSRFSART